MKLLIVAVALALEACPPSPALPDASPDAAPPPIAVVDAAPPLQPDASTPSLAACANLAALGCAEGKAANCAATVDHVVAEKLTPVNVACLTSAKTKAGARACGFASCK